MGRFTGIVVFLLTWWILLFTVLPFGHVRDEDGTPKDPHIKQKFIWTTIIAIVVWLCIYGLIEADLISFRDIARHMMEEDYQ